MSGERIAQRRENSDGGLSAINVSWSGPYSSRDAAVALCFSNGMVTTPDYHIMGLTADDVEAVASSLQEIRPPYWIHHNDQDGPPLDEATLSELVRAASTKLTTHEAQVLQQSNQPTCAICLAGYARDDTVLCMPCGRDAACATACHVGHVGHLKCLQEALRRKNACPLCRTPFRSAHDDRDACQAALRGARRNLLHVRAEAAKLKDMSKVERSVVKRSGGVATPKGVIARASSARRGTRRV
jgi:hypothetical protein